MWQDVLDSTRRTEPRKAGMTRAGFAPWYIYTLTLRCGHTAERREKHPKAFERVDCKKCSATKDVP